MDVNVQAGNWYVVEGDAGDTVTNPLTGRVIATVEDGKQTAFLATTPYVVTSSDSVDVHKVNFNSAPAKLKLLGLLGGGTSTGGELPAGYMRAEFLECAAKSYCNLELTQTPNTGVKFKVWQNDNAYMVLSGNMLDATQTNTFYSLISNNSCVGINIKGALYFKKDGSYASSGSAISKQTGFVVEKSFLVGSINWLNDGKIVFSSENFNEARNLPTQIPTSTKNLYLGTQGGIRYNNYRGRIYYFSVSEGDREISRCVPAIDDSGEPLFYDTVLKRALPNVGSGAFIVGMTTEQARKLDKLPAGEGTLTISIPSYIVSGTTVVDPAVNAALTTARGNGWNITVQTYEEEATAAASTFGFRRIWVRKTEDENGTYVDAEGTRWQVDWCVTMYTPDDSTPDMHGYELFRSVEAACEYWGLEPWVDPAWEEELLT